jgi:L-lactate dehydrogenase complex protein LldG
MSTDTSSRQAILDRIRSATQNAKGVAYLELPRNYVRSGSLARSAVIQLMIERLREYGAEVMEAEPGALATIIQQQLQATHKRSFVVPPDLPNEWLSANAGLRWNVDHGLSAEEIERCDGVMTAAFAGVADSGTIVLHHSGTEGRRIITLLPDWHLCILRASQVVETLPEYFDRCTQPPPLATYISGPSATADIEMTRIKGVHGPRFLSVILVRDEAIQS